MTENWKYVVVNNAKESAEKSDDVYVKKSF
jgi:hypothetical protein